MPRLGEDPNIATAYPNRHQMARGGFLRQLFSTALGSLLIYFIFNKVYLTDYRGKTRDSMTKQGINEKMIDRYVPWTRTELTSRMKKKETTNLNRIATLENNVRNLTLSVLELQQALVNTTGVTLKHPVNATAILGEGVVAGATVVEGEENIRHGGGARRRKKLRG